MRSLIGYVFLVGLLFPAFTPASLTTLPSETATNLLDITSTSPSFSRPPAFLSMSATTSNLELLAWTVTGVSVSNEQRETWLS